MLLARNRSTPRDIARRLSGPEPFPEADEQGLQRHEIVFEAGNQNTTVDSVRPGAQMGDECFQNYAGGIDSIVGWRASERAR